MIKIKGIYAYYDNKRQEFVYVGKDSYLDKQARHKAHTAKYNKDKQVINRIIQANPDRYTYQILVWSVEDEETLNALETMYITNLKPKFCYTNGGDGITGYRHTEESKQKISEAQKGNQYALGYHHTDEAKQKISEATRGENNPMYSKSHTKESKNLMSVNLSQIVNSSGLYRVTIKKNKRYKNNIGFEYRYYQDDGKRKSIFATDLTKLKQKILDAGLKWQYLDSNNALKTILTDLIAKVPPEKRIKVQRNIKGTVH